MTDIIDDIPSWLDDTAATEEELIENEVGYLAGPHIRADGKRGLFVNSATKEEAPVVRGIVVARFEGQLLFGGEGSELFPSFDNWICRNDYKAKAMPRVNDQAPKAVLAELARQGGGVDCRSCELRKFGENNERPNCGAQWVLVFIDDRYDEPVPLFVRGSSISAMHAFLKGDDFRIKRGKQAGQLQPSMIRRIELKMVQDKKDGKSSMSFYKIEFKALGYVADIAKFEELRQLGLNALRTFAQAAVAAPRPSLAALTAGSARLALPAPRDINDPVPYDGFSDLTDDDYVPEASDAF